MELIVELLLEVGFELIVELLFSLGWEGAAGAMGRRREVHPVASAVALFLLGALLGSGLAYLLPRPLSSHAWVSLAGVVLNPLLLGFIMMTLGTYRRERGKHATRLSTFWGGASFAFGASLARYAWIMA